MNWIRLIDMVINVKTSWCVCIGPRNDFSCEPLNRVAIPWVNELRYLDIFIVRSRNFKCLLTNAKKSFYRSNAVFDKIGRIVPEEATVELISSKRILVLIYGW